MSIFADPNQHPSSALVVMENLMEADRQQQEYDDLMRVLREPKPVWFGAKGFDAAYEACAERLRWLKQLGSFEPLDDLSEMHCYLGRTLHETHGVLTIPYTQLSALPRIGQKEMQEIGRTIRLPMSSYFIDVSSEYVRSQDAVDMGDDARYLPRWPAPRVAIDGSVGYMGTLMTHHSTEPEILLSVPFVLYNEGTLGGGVSCLGMTAINQSDDLHKTFSWDDKSYTFSAETRFKAMIPESEFTDKHSEVLDTYSDVIGHGTGQALGVLHLLNAANVRTVEATLEKRDRKKVDKRGWDVPQVVYVHRSKRRSPPKQVEATPTGRQHSHQYDVVGFEAHVKRGTHVRCKVCLNDPIPGVECSRCHGTGLDPEKVKPCTRIDEATGEKTCPQGCRREYHPPSVRGPEGAVYVPKVRKLVD